MFANLAAAAATAVLALSSGRNMVQTVQVSQQDARKMAKSSCDDSATNNAMMMVQTSSDSSSTEAVVKYFQKLKRKDLLTVYFCSRAPETIEEIEGEWDGCLLDNNGLVMVRILHM